MPVFVAWRLAIVIGSVLPCRAVIATAEIAATLSSRLRIIRTLRSMAARCRRCLMIWAR
jgi:hypothetical protein